MSGNTPSWADEDRKTEDSIDAEFTEVPPKKVRLPKKKDGINPGTALQVMAWAATNDKTESDVRAVVSNLSITDHIDSVLKARNDMFTGIFKKDVSNGEALANVLFTRAVAGDMSAIREILNRTEGKVPNRTINSSTSTQVKGTATELSALMDKIDSNNKKI